MMKDALMEYETIDSDQIDDIMAGREARDRPQIGADTGCQQFGCWCDPALPTVTE